MSKRYSTSPNTTRVGPDVHRKESNSRMRRRARRRIRYGPSIAVQQAPKDYLTAPKPSFTLVR